MTFTESLMARRIYDLERQRDERTYAGDHLFEEWVQRYLRDCGASFVQSVYLDTGQPNTGERWHRSFGIGASRNS